MAHFLKFFKFFFNAIQLVCFFPFASVDNFLLDLADLLQQFVTFLIDFGVNDLQLVQLAAGLVLESSRLVVNGQLGFGAHALHQLLPFFPLPEILWLRVVSLSDGLVVINIFSDIVHGRLLILKHVIDFRFTNLVGLAILGDNLP